MIAYATRSCLHGVLIGTEIENILTYNTKSSNCSARCKKKACRKNKLDCRMNWGDSS